MKRKAVAAALAIGVILSLLPVYQSQAWWSNGHRLMTTEAIKLIPDPEWRQFFEHYAYFLNETCVWPDSIYKAEDPMEDDFAKAVRLMGLIPVLESIRELRISGMDMEAVVTWHDNRLILRPIRATPLSELTTLLSLAEAGVLEEPEVEITAMSEREFEEFMARLLLGKLEEEDLYENKAFVPIRRELAKLVVEHVPHEGEVKILEDKVVVRNALGEWEV